MPIFQSYNKRIKAYVKGHIQSDEKGIRSFRVINVKQREPQKPFKNVPIRKRK